jgi:mRNA interferase MazF
MRRGEIRLVDLDPARGAEANKRRPAILVSNDAANATAEQLRRGVLTVIPITSNVEHVYPFQVLLPRGTGGVVVDSKVQAEHVRSVAVQRIGERLGHVPPAVMASVDDALRLHLSL